MGPTELLEYLSVTLGHLGIPYFITGSIASIFYGEPRFTNDIDVVIELQTKDIDVFCQSFPSPEYYLSPASVRDAVRQRFQFNIIQTTSGLKIDVIIPDDSEFEKSRRQRTKTMTLPKGQIVHIASAEDLILRKMEFYQEGGSEKHLRDIAGILRIQKETLELAYIEKWADVLQVQNIWNAIRNKEEQS